MCIYIEKRLYNWLKRYLHKSFKYKTFPAITELLVNPGKMAKYYIYDL